MWEKAAIIQHKVHFIYLNTWSSYALLKCIFIFIIWWTWVPPSESADSLIVIERLLKEEKSFSYLYACKSQMWMCSSAHQKENWRSPSCRLRRAAASCPSECVLCGSHRHKDTPGKRRRPHLEDSRGGNSHEQKVDLYLRCSQKHWMFTGWSLNIYLSVFDLFDRDLFTIKCFDPLTIIQWNLNQFISFI